MAASSSSASVPSTFESASPELLQQIQMGFNAFWMMQKFAEGQNGQQSSPSYSGGIFPTYPAQLFPNQMNISANMVAPSAEKHVEKEEEEEKERRKSSEPPQLSPIGKCPGEEEEGEEEEKMEKDEKEKEPVTEIPSRPSVLDKRWEFVDTVKSFTEFEHLRCLHQVSRNRTFAYGIRYSCTQKTQMRSNCPYLLVCIFADGAGENSLPGVGKITVYSRNSHTHPVKAIKRRLPRNLARQAKREREERERLVKLGKSSGEENEGEEKVAGKGRKEEAQKEINEPKMGGNEDDEIQILEKVPASSVITAQAPIQQQQADSLAANDSPKADRDKLMDLLTELSRHFASTVEEQKQKGN